MKRVLKYQMIMTFFDGSLKKNNNEKINKNCYLTFFVISSDYQMRDKI